MSRYCITSLLTDCQARNTSCIELGFIFLGIQLIVSTECSMYFSHYCFWLPCKLIIIRIKHNGIFANGQSSCIESGCPIFMRGRGQEGSVDILL